MESPILSVLFFILPTLLFFLLFLKKPAQLHKSTKPINLPPGPWKLPIIGNLHQLIGEHPHRRFQKLAQSYGPLLHLKLGQINLIVITSAEFVRAIFKTHDLSFASRPNLLAGEIILYNNADFGLAPYGKTWSNLRKICAVELFSLKRVKSFSFIREEEGNKLVEKIRSAGKSRPVNLSEMLLRLSNVTIARAAFGKEGALQDRALAAIKKAFEYLSGFNAADLFPSWGFVAEMSGLRRGMQRVHEELDGVLSEIIEEGEKKSLGGDGKEETLVDVLLRVKRNGEMELSLTRENVKAVILDVFLGGSESTSTTLVWAMTELIRFPEVMRKAQSEVRKAFHGKPSLEEEVISKLPYLHQVIKETLRLHSTVPLLVPRSCRETVELAGYTIPVESRVVVNAWALMRDPKRWEDPEIFRPERFEENALDFGSADYEFIPFGGGRRICPGISFALASMELWLAQLLFYFDWELPGKKSPQELDVEEAFGLTLFRKNDLCLVATYQE